jgi:hypothetical protein
MKVHSKSLLGKAGILRFALAVFGLVLATMPAFAQAAGGEVAEYSAKFVCGTPTAAQVATEAIAVGTYATSINIHNPASDLFTSQTSLSFVKKAVISLPEGTTPIAPSSLVQDNLQNDFSEYVSCTTIRKLLGSAAPPSPAFIEGWVIILVPPTAGTTGSPITNVLDVWGVYTNLKGEEQVIPATERFFIPGGPIAMKLENTKEPKPKKGN